MNAINSRAGHGAAERDPTDAANWAAVQARDAAAAFFYAVATTGVFCRPSCAARPARPEHVSFFPTAAAAVQAGFRPCKRCRPDLPPKPEREQALVAKACRQIESAEDPPSLDELANNAGLSLSHFHRLFRRIVGVTPRGYAAGRRAHLLQSGLPAASTVTEAFYDAGFNSPGRFYAAAPGLLGMTPSAYRVGAPGETIQHAAGKSALGDVLVAATGIGVCAILLGDDAETLAADLRARFPRAQLRPGDAEFTAWVAEVVSFVDAPAAGPLALPLDIRGTAFQRRVWEALRAIPPGETRTYSAMAAELGAPNAVRAVAGACAANALAVAVPCHRVIGADGGLSGYRWGLHRKRALLDREKA